MMPHLLLLQLFTIHPIGWNFSLRTTWSSGRGGKEREREGRKGEERLSALTVGVYAGVFLIKYEFSRRALLLQAVPHHQILPLLHVITAAALAFTHSNPNILPPRLPNTLREFCDPPPDR
jgi:hypothetical protein